MTQQGFIRLQFKDVNIYVKREFIGSFFWAKMTFSFLNACGVGSCTKIVSSGYEKTDEI